MLSDLLKPRLLDKPLRGDFTPEDQLPKFLELMRWPRGIECPRCCSRNSIKFRKSKRKPEGRYLYNCRRWRRQFTVTTGTALHRAHVPMAKWLEAVALIRRNSSRTLMPTVLMRRLGVTYKTARLMCRRLRRGMKTAFVRCLYVNLRTYGTTEEIFHNLFPGLHKD